MNDQAINRDNRKPSARRVPLRLVRMDDRQTEEPRERTPRKAPAVKAVRAKPGADEARVQRVCAGRATRGATLGGRIQVWHGPNGDRFYAYGYGSDVNDRIRLGVYMTKAEAERVIRAFADANDQAEHDQSIDVESWIDDWCVAVSRGRRRELADDPKSPILHSWYRIGAPPLMQRQIARLFGDVTHQRIDQTERAAKSRPSVRKALLGFYGQTGAKYDHWDQARDEAMG